MKFIYFLAGTTPRLSALVSFQGAKRSHRFIWSETHKAHVYEGRELDAKEFNGLTDEFYAHNHNECYFKVVPRVVEIEAVDEGEAVQLPETGVPKCNLGTREEEEAAPAPVATSAEAAVVAEPADDVTERKPFRKLRAQLPV